MTALEIIHLVLNTTEDTSTLLYRCLKNATKKDKEIVLTELRRPYSELEKQYIHPNIYVIENENFGTLNFHYKEGVDDKYIENDFLLREEATMNWVHRKESELKVLLKLFEPTIFETIKIEKFELISNELFNYLIKYKFIDITTDKNIFKSIFLGNIIYEKPRIKWLKGIPHFNMFFQLLNIHELINLSSKEDAVSKKLFVGEFFINSIKDNRPFERLSKRKEEFEKRLNEYLHNKSKDFQDLKDLEDIIKKLRKN